ncbi:hypothetical protein CCOS865_04914 [Pseudomonas reidholzensis]|uniref:Uncharacterized protein n=1 Tax=Pseudomonas reidholzensis TaxID=1785162 RepID=A0A383S171_9PSED|nr:hypothetical protein [Pseudomonas reidholzensis]SYX92624.1 hypothetical protein CCOS865_04914 [Pseudomonas reidholzensis]
MVTHYSTNGLDSACGRSSQTLVSTAVTDDVSCKSCQRSLVKPDAAPVRKSPSLAELRKSAKAAAAPVVATATAPVAKPAVKAVHTPAPSAAVTTQPAANPAPATGYNAKAAWAARLAEQAGQSRLPRGKKARQQHV